MAYEIFDGLYIAEDGNYGGGAVILCSHEAFTDEQAEILDSLGDNSRYDYAMAVLNGKDTSEWEDLEEYCADCAFSRHDGTSH